MPKSDIMINFFKYIFVDTDLDCPKKIEIPTAAQLNVPLR
jgi:hypothetical protein